MRKWLSRTYEIENEKFACSNRQSRSRIGCIVTKGLVGHHDWPRHNKVQVIQEMRPSHLVPADMLITPVSDSTFGEGDAGTDGSMGR